MTFSCANFDINKDKQIDKEIKHIGVPPAVVGHFAVPVNSPSVPVEAIKVTIPTKKKKAHLRLGLGIRCEINAMIKQARTI